MIARAGLALAAAAGIAASAGAVGLGPLVKEGVTDGPDKAFYLTLINPYPTREAFRVYAVGLGDEEAATRVRLLNPRIEVPGETNRRFVAIVGELTPGERFTFRLCAERIEHQEGSIHARVCSRITARRLPARG